MTDRTHPSLDDLADLYEGLLPSPRAQDLAAHVAGCDTCATTSAALEDVTRALSGAAAAKPSPMPGSVAASLDEALHRASRERAAGVPSLSQYRDSSRPETVPARRPRWAWVAGAAAAVAIGYAGVNVLDGTPDSDDSAGSTTDAAEAEADGLAARRTPASIKDGSPSTGSLPESAGEDLSAVTRRTLPAFAGRLAERTAPVDTKLSACSPVTVSADDRTAIVRWRGARALLVVDPANRRATVYRCTGDADRLFTTEY